MADWIDQAVENQDLVTRFEMDKQRAAASRPLDPGVAGECDRCGEYSPRLVGGACAPCRDRLKLP